MNLEEIAAYFIIYLVLAFGVFPAIVSPSDSGTDYKRDLKWGFQLQGLILGILVFCVAISWAIDTVFGL